MRSRPARPYRSVRASRPGPRSWAWGSPSLSPVLVTGLRCPARSTNGCSARGITFPERLFAVKASLVHVFSERMFDASTEHLYPAPMADATLTDRQRQILE